MCGRYRLSSAERFLERFNAESDIEWSPRYNVAPGQQVAVIRQDPQRPVRVASKMKWGLIPFWAKDANIGYKMINARSETVLEKPAYREAIKHRRCLIPADGFYEWKKIGKDKQPFHFGMRDGSLFAFAGIWEHWKNPEGQMIESCSILTTTPNVLLADVHDRMPVILPDEAYDLWLDPGFKRASELADLLHPFDASLMQRYPVSTRMNMVKNDDAECAAEMRVGAAGA